jgi:hypothetical protein
LARVFAALFLAVLTVGCSAAKPPVVGAELWDDPAAKACETRATGRLDALAIVRLPNGAAFWTLFPAWPRESRLYRSTNGKLQAFADPITVVVHRGAAPFDPLDDSGPAAGTWDVCVVFPQDEGEGLTPFDVHGLFDVPSEGSPLMEQLEASAVPD